MSDKMDRGLDEIIADTVCLLLQIHAALRQPRMSTNTSASDPNAPIVLRTDAVEVAAVSLAQITLVMVLERSVFTIPTLASLC